MFVKTLVLFSVYDPLQVLVASVVCGGSRVLCACVCVVGKVRVTCMEWGVRVRVSRLKENPTITAIIFQGFRPQQRPYF